MRYSLSDVSGFVRLYHMPTEPGYLESPSRSIEQVMTLDIILPERPISAYLLRCRTVLFRMSRDELIYRGLIRP